jgi:AcrR family transcriptional regulator
MPRSQFKGLTITERKQLRRQKIIQAGIERYGTAGFFAVTVKEICVTAHLTERYFYESFKKSDELFQCIFLQLIAELQGNILRAMAQSDESEAMLHNALHAFLTTLKNNPGMARIIYIDAMLIQELHQQAYIRQTMQRFESIVLTLLRKREPEHLLSESELSWVATGINGHVTHIAIRWVMDHFEQDLADVLAACALGFRALHTQK